MIPLTKPYLPPLEEFGQYLNGIWGRSQVSNDGPLVQELEERLKEQMGVQHVCLVSSGTMALQIALKALDIQHEVITTAYSHVSTVNTLLWNGNKPVFADIEDSHFCIDPARIEVAVGERTRAILATHVYGYPCQVEKIRAIAEKYGLKVLYDGAHAFGVQMHGRPVFEWGDATAVSFHATKVYHTIEGGAIVTNDEKTAAACRQLRNFGMADNRLLAPGINGKLSELHAAVGLCNLPRVADFISRRRQLWYLYRELLREFPVQLPDPPAATSYNYAYMPVLFDSHHSMLAVFQGLADAGVTAKRYFYPSLNRLPYLAADACPVAEGICERILCLPLYYDLASSQVERIVQIVSKHVEAVPQQA